MTFLDIVIVGQILTHNSIKRYVYDFRLFMVQLIIKKLPKDTSAQDLATFVSIIFIENLVQPGSEVETLLAHLPTTIKIDTIEEAKGIAFELRKLGIITDILEEEFDSIDKNEDYSCKNPTELPLAFDIRDEIQLDFHPEPLNTALSINENTHDNRITETLDLVDDLTSMTLQDITVSKTGKEHLKDLDLSLETTDEIESLAPITINKDQIEKTHHEINNYNLKQQNISLVDNNTNNITTNEDTHKESRPVASDSMRIAEISNTSCHTQVKFSTKDTLDAETIFHGKSKASKYLKNPEVMAKVFAIILFTLLLFLVSLFVCSQSSNSLVTELDTKEIDKLLKEQKEILEKIDLPKQASKTIHLEGRSNLDNLQVTAKLTIVDEKLNSLNLYITQQESEKTSSQDIIKGIKRSPWLKSIEISISPKDITQISNIKYSNQTIELATPSKAYITDDSVNARIVTNMKIAILAPEPKTNSRILTWEIKNGDLIATNSAKKTSGNNFDFNYSGELRVLPDDPQ